MHLPLEKDISHCTMWKMEKIERSQEPVHTSAGASYCFLAMHCLLYGRQDWAGLISPALSFVKILIVRGAFPTFIARVKSRLIVNSAATTTHPV